VILLEFERVLMIVLKYISTSKLKYFLLNSNVNFRFAPSLVVCSVSKELITLDKLRFCECKPTVAQDSINATLDEVVDLWNHHTEQQNLCEVEEDVLLYVGGATHRASASCTNCSSLI
jgi:hypothetical protein